MAKYSKGAGKKVKVALHEMKEGELKSGRSGKKVTNPKQAIAIGLSEARERGEEVPSKKDSTQKSAPKKASKTPAKRGTSTIKSGGGKTAVKKAASKSTGRKSPANAKGSNSTGSKADRRS